MEFSFSSSSILFAPTDSKVGSKNFICSFPCYFCWITWTVVFHGIDFDAFVSLSYIIINHVKLASSYIQEQEKLFGAFKLTLTRKIKQKLLNIGKIFVRKQRKMSNFWCLCQEGNLTKIPFPQIQIYTSSKSWSSYELTSQHRYNHWDQM